ncbi:MAG: hypothetical protein ACI39N_07415 [Lachnospiraceae bacterium]
MAYTTYLGGSDGPTSVFLAGNLGFGWLNTFGLILIILLMIPNIIYAIKVKDKGEPCPNKVMVILEQIGRFASMFLMIFNIGIAEFGFSSVSAFFIYNIGNVILMIFYWTFWILYFADRKRYTSIGLAVIPTLMFLLCGLTMRHILLIISAIIFGIGHIYITYQAGKVQEQKYEE